MFLQVKETLPSFTQYLHKNEQLGDGSHFSDIPIQYHVEGDINAAYSDILLNQICNQR